MTQSPGRVKKPIILNVLFFSVLYLACIQTEKQLLRAELAGFSLPFKLTPIIVLAGFGVGAILTILVTYLLAQKQVYFQILLFLSLITGSFLLNYHVNMNIFFPYSINAPGDLLEFGNTHWANDYPYEMYSTVFEKYYLHTISINPNTDNLEELRRINRFGVYLEETEEVPILVSEEDFLRIEKILGNSFVELNLDENIFRLYDVAPEDGIILTRTENMLVFLPSGSLKK